MNNGKVAGAADAAAVVLILKKTQGSVWSEAGRTPLCPTIGWLRETYGHGQYELRLKLGNRILCMANAECAQSSPGTPSALSVVPSAPAKLVRPVGAPLDARGTPYG
jgi:hypothetical protein